MTDAEFQWHQDKEEDDASLEQAAREFFGQSQANDKIIPSIPKLMSAFARQQIEAERVKAKKVCDALEGWLAWWNGPAQEGISYIDPPIRRSQEALAELRGKGGDDD